MSFQNKKKQIVDNSLARNEVIGNDFIFRFDIKHTDNEVTYLECFCVITSGIKQNANGSRLKQMIIDRSILADAIEYITILAPPVKTLLA